MIINAIISADYASIVDQVKIEKLRERFHQFVKPQGYGAHKGEPGMDFGYQPVLLSYEDLVFLGSLGCSFQPKDSDNLMLVKMQGMITGLKNDVEELRIEGRTSVVVHAPNSALMSYNKIQLLENACSDDVQDSLNDGWRIIAVCPPNCQRRPDYILGKYDPSYKNDASRADRG